MDVPSRNELERKLNVCLVEKVVRGQFINPATIVNFFMDQRPLFDTDSELLTRIYSAEIRSLVRKLLTKKREEEINKSLEEKSVKSQKYNPSNLYNDLINLLLVTRKEIGDNQEVDDKIENFLCDINDAKREWQKQKDKEEAEVVERSNELNIIKDPTSLCGCRRAKHKHEDAFCVSTVDEVNEIVKLYLDRGYSIATPLEGFPGSLVALKKNKIRIYLLSSKQWKALASHIWEIINE